MASHFCGAREEYTALISSRIVLACASVLRQLPKGRWGSSASSLTALSKWATRELKSVAKNLSALSTSASGQLGDLIGLFNGRSVRVDHMLKRVSFVRCTLSTTPSCLKNRHYTQNPRAGRKTPSAPGLAPPPLLILHRLSMDGFPGEPFLQILPSQHHQKPQRPSPRNFLY